MREFNPDKTCKDCIHYTEKLSYQYCKKINTVLDSDENKICEYFEEE